MSKSVKAKTLKCKVPETQLKISSFFGGKAAVKKDESKLFTKTTSVSDSGSKGPVALLAPRNQGKLLASAKENVPENVICLDDVDSDMEAENALSKPVNDYCPSSPSLHENMSATNEDACQDPCTPTRILTNPVNADSSPDIICETPGEDTILSDRPRRAFSSRSFLCTSDSLSGQPDKKPTSFLKKTNRPILNISVQFNKTCQKDQTLAATVADDSPLFVQDITNDQHSNIPVQNIPKSPVLTESLVNSNIAATSKNLSIKELLTTSKSINLSRNDFSDRGMILADECSESVKITNQSDNSGLQPVKMMKQGGDIIKNYPGCISDFSNRDGQDSNAENRSGQNIVIFSTCKSSSSNSLKAKTLTKSKSDSGYTNLQVSALLNKSKPKLLDALENPEMKSDQSEASQWISRKLLQHITDNSCLTRIDTEVEPGDNLCDTTPKKIYNGSRLTIKRQAKSGSSPVSKRFPPSGYTHLKDGAGTVSNVAAGPCVYEDHARRILCLEDVVHEVELGATNERRSKFTKERAYQFGFIEKEKSGSKDKNVTLENDKVLAELLNSMSSRSVPSTLEKKFNNCSSASKKLSKDVRSGFKTNTVSCPQLQDTRNLNTSDIEMLNNLFGSDEDNNSISINGCVTEVQEKDSVESAEKKLWKNNDVIIIEDSQAPGIQGNDFIELFDSMEEVVSLGVISADNAGNEVVNIHDKTKPLDPIGVEINSIDPLVDKIMTVQLKSADSLNSSAVNANQQDSVEYKGQEPIQSRIGLETKNVCQTLEATALEEDASVSKRRAEEFNEELFNFSFDNTFDCIDTEKKLTKSNVCNEEFKKDFTFTDLWQRFTVTEVSHERNTSEVLLSLKNEKTGQQQSCLLKGFWADSVVEKNDVVNIIGEFENDNCTLTDGNGLIVVNPDFLLSGTLVVSSLFCARKSVLKEKFQGIEKGNIQMFYGSVIHSLFQHAVKENLRDERAVIAKAKSLLRSSKFLHEMYGQSIEEHSVMEEINNYIPSLLNWLKKHTDWTRKENAGGKQSSDVVVKEIHDIEENIWSPKFGIKGKIDMTIEAALKRSNTHSEVKILPLELKTGKASFSSEHKGQVTLYSMMYSDRRTEPNEGILLYLKTGEMQIVPAKPESKSGLLQLRNQLAYYLNTQVKREDSLDNVTYSLGKLPSPINNPRTCANCSQLLNCSIYQRFVEHSDPCKDQSMNTLVDEAVSHLDADELDYYKFWMLCLDLEMMKKIPKDIWCVSSTEREKRGDCIQNLSITDSTLGIPDSQFFTEGEGCSLTFTRETGTALSLLGFTSGDLVVVSSEDGRYIALTTGFIRSITASSVEVVVDRDYLHDTSHFTKMKFRLDRNDGLSTSGYLYTNLSRLMDSSAKMMRLRELIIKKSQPNFELKLSKSLVEKVKPIFKTLNKPQRSAILKVLMAKDYVLIKGFPGTGKTSTIVALVKILQLSGQSVLLTSFTHSAVDNILLKLKEDGVRFLRLGRKGRIHPHILPYSAEVVSTAPGINDVQKLKLLYDSYDIVATSSFGINHPIFSQRKFDVCIVDEASQILQPACLGPLFHSNKFVLVGDPKQLPPIVQSKEARNLCMDESLFSRLENCGGAFDLNLQYRMNRVIMELCNKLVYNGKLQCGSTEVAEKCIDLDLEKIQCSSPWMRDALSPLLERSVVFLDTQLIHSTESMDGKGLVNVVEADLVIMILMQLLKTNINPESIGVIAPYRSQIKLIKLKAQSIAELDEVEVNTVDQYQGRDKSVIIVSFVRTKNDNMGELLKDLRRLNVAITRAKHKLILIGNTNTLHAYEYLAQLISHLETNKNILLIPEEWES